MIFSLFDFPIKAARIHIKKSVELINVMSKFLYFKFSAHLITNTRHYAVNLLQPSRDRTPFFGTWTGFSHFLSLLFYISQSLVINQILLFTFPFKFLTKLFNKRDDPSFTN